MQIELFINGEKKLFTTPFVPMLAKRKYLEVQANIEKNKPNTAEEIIEEDDKLYSILSDVVFNRQFTLEQLYEGASQQYAQDKLAEAVYGIKPKNKKENEEGNEKGE